jgi:Pyruvate/2-oxoacid:ferredoxin oxidoreductase delta subunit
MPAIAEEIDEADEEGVAFHYLATPAEVLTEDGRVRGLRCLRMRLGEPDESGRRRPEPIPGSEFDLDVDTVILALGQVTDLNGLPEDISRNGQFVQIEPSGMTSREGVFAGGDAATGYGTVTHAIGSGKRAALAIDRYVRGEPLGEFPPLHRNVQASPREKLGDVVTFEELNPFYFQEEERPAEKHLPMEERLRSFAESNLGLDAEAVQREGLRCFSCGTCNRCDNCLNFCPDMSVTRSGDWFKSGLEYPFYEFLYDYCKGCGICAAECPRRAITMEEELLWRK